MNKTATILHSAVAALLVGALALPGTVLARGHDGYDGDGYRHEYRERHHEGRRGHWGRHDHGHRGYDDRVVVVREPVYVEPRRAVVAAPLWAPLASGITVVLGTTW